MFCLILMVSVAQLSVSDTLWTEEADGYQIEVFFPEIVLENEYVRNTLQENALEQIESFKEQFREYYIDELHTIEWALDLRFIHEPSPENMACIVNWTWAYTGGAHGNSNTQSIIFNLNDSSLISTLELLGGEENFERFASSVLARLQEIGVEETWAERGASADTLNYHTVYPVPDENGGISGYTVIFPPYQVECYAAGPIEVFVPK